MSHRIQIVLPDPTAAQLQELAAAAGEPPSTLAAQLVRHGVDQAAKDGKVRPPRRAPVIVGSKSGERARWLEPWGEDIGWRAQMWAEIVALHGRYPTALAHLNDEWWTDDTHTEMLCALAVWRSDLDDAGMDPREELYFHSQLTAYSEALRQQGGGVTKTWKPGAPPRSGPGKRSRVSSRLLSAGKGAPPSPQPGPSVVQRERECSPRSYARSAGKALEA